MRPEIKTRWTEALRSGNYIQGTGNLHLPAENEHCCLGVLCEIAAADGIVTKKVIQDNSVELTRYVGPSHQDGSTERLPRAVWTWAGLGGPDPVLEYGQEDDGIVHDPISELNDTYGLDFETLASLIEEQL